MVGELEDPGGAAGHLDRRREIVDEAWPGDIIGVPNHGTLRVGDALNLEKSLTLATPLGGHFVSGHVDGVGSVAAIAGDARSQRWVFRAPAELLPYIASKGSIAVDGVSLTVNELYPDGFGVNLIPHTLAHTRFGTLGVGAPVNLEVDLIARYVERLLAARGGP